MALRVVQRHTFAVLPLPDSVPAFPARVPALPQFGQWPPGGVTAARSPRSASTGISVFSVQLAADVTTGSAMRQRSSTQNALVRCMTACCPSDGHARLKPVGHVGRGWPVDHYGNHQQAKDDRRPDADTDQGGIFISPCAFRIVFRIPRPYDRPSSGISAARKSRPLLVGFSGYGCHPPGCVEAPHWVQNAAPSGSCAPQYEQNFIMDVPFRFGRFGLFSEAPGS